MLLLHRQPREQRQDLHRRSVWPPGEAPGQELGGLTDFALAGKEYQNVARTFAPQVLRRRDNRLFERLLVVGLVLAGRILACTQRAVANLDREHPSLDVDHRRARRSVPEMAGEAVRIERRRGDDQLEIGPPRQQLLQVTEQKIDVQAALVRFVDDDRVVGGEHAIGLSLGQEDAVGHQFYIRVGTRLVAEAHLVADDLSQRRGQLLRDPRRDAAGGDAPRLRMPDQPADAAPVLEADLGQLRGLAGAGLAADDDCLVRTHCGGDVVAPRRHRELRRVNDSRDACRAAQRAVARSGDRARNAFDLGRRHTRSLQSSEAPRQLSMVGSHALA